MSDGSRLEKIAKRAYELFEARGGLPGNDLGDWLRAEREIAASDKTVSAPKMAAKSTVKAASRK